METNPDTGSTMGKTPHCWVFGPKQEVRSLHHPFCLSALTCCDEQGEPALSISCQYHCIQQVVGPSRTQHGHLRGLWDLSPLRRETSLLARRGSLALSCRRIRSHPFFPRLKLNDRFTNSKTFHEKSDDSEVRQIHYHMSRPGLNARARFALVLFVGH